ncbi:MAG: sigma-70 family RNA polymerase sigma factor [Bacteroidetes bacterium]|nr:sigma-70 family RNA polymerase sigma factor [Bacteroidota bacterium]
MKESKSKYTEQQLLIEQIINRDSNAVKKVIPKLRKSLSFFLFKQNKLNSENLRELVNETFAAAFQNKIPKLSCSAVRYLSKIGENIWLLKRRRNKEIPVSMQDLDSMPHNNVILELTDDDLYILYLAKSKLPEKSQKILEYYSLNYDSDIAAKRLGFSNKNIYQSRKYECLVELRKQYNRLTRLTYNKYV